MKLLSISLITAMFWVFFYAYAFKPVIWVKLLDAMTLYLIDHRDLLREESFQAARPMGAICAGLAAVGSTVILILVSLGIYH